ncbi:Imm43 family immunity protein [Phytobacter ursingii]|uniref:Imm43 family immunity protein n=1 Tax=Phytobacter ursingii TaxID=1972431 RepID=UPI0026D60D7F
MFPQKMQGNELMCYYVIMNDFKSTLIPRNLQGIVDEKLKIDENWEVEGSDFSFPYRIKDDACPEHIFLLCNKDVGALKFDYYKKDFGHLIDKSLFSIFENYNHNVFFDRDITPVSIGNGQILCDDFKYVYFPGDNVIDKEKSILEEDKFGDIIPFKIEFKDDALAYDILSFSDTLLGGFIIIKQEVKEAIEKKRFRGLKFVRLENALDVFCEDYFYEIDSNRKRKRNKLP